jgi:hypothetical protein
MCLMPPLCNVRRFLASNPQVPQKPGWYYVIGSVEHSEKEDRYRFCALYGPGFEVLRGGQYSRVLLDLHGIIVDASVVRGEKRRVCLPLPKEFNSTWAQLYGGCHLAYLIPKRMFLTLTDQLINNYMATHIYRKYITPKMRDF